MSVMYVSFSLIIEFWRRCIYDIVRPSYEAPGDEYGDIDPWLDINFLVIRRGLENELEQLQLFFHDQDHQNEKAVSHRQGKSS